ncbi:DUF4403 family protein [Deinococcus radiophilus]|uniref:DUF4403 family protein n=1 Tax=Deinococcus radiophilus TaxID=32062 RepID=A0A3S0JN88_9DEIO|nr:DUF4403 family protein [Deinococcus radiophilus]RTR25544.1 DUF4403 family protein [Deinococcus radiophilus]UFA50509.1 DUF4403 family protein [Deinococcus radiophilus]
MTPDPASDSPALSRSQQAPQLPLSSVVLPVMVPLDGVRQAVNARVPREFARIDREQRVLGGAAGVQIRGVVARQGDIRIVPSASGNTLELEVPLSAEFAVRPELSGAAWAGRLEQSLTRDFGGQATVRMRVRPYIQPDWEAGAQVSSELTWTDPLAIELLPGTRLSVASLAEGAVRAQMERVTQEVVRAVRESAALRERAEQLWTMVQRPWSLPLEGNGVDQAYAQVMPMSLAVSGLRLQDDALHLSLEAEGYLRAELGQPPVTRPTAAPLPALRVTSQATPSELHLRVPILLPFAEMSELVTAAVRQELLGLRLPGGALAPELRLTDIQVQREDDARRLRLSARLAVTVLGRTRTITAQLSGRPWLRPGGQEVTLENVKLDLDADVPGAAWLGPWLAERLEPRLANAARFDLSPRLNRLEETVAARLPFSPLPGLNLRGDLGDLRLDDLRVTAQGLEVVAAADGALDVLVSAGQLGRR